jgi:hypothetical protein
MEKQEVGPCEGCPIPDICLRRPVYCDWMAKEPRNPVQERTVINAARRAKGLPPISGQISGYPSLATQAINATKAIGRVVAAIAKGEPVYVSADEQERRRAICLPCEHNGEKPPGIRCKLCGCGGLKLALATEACKAGKWETVTGPR